MTTKFKTAGSGSELTPAILKGTGISLLLTLAGGAGMSALIINEKLQETAIGYAAMGILIIGTMAGVVPAVKSVLQQKLLAALATAAGYFLTLALLNMVFFNGIYEGLSITGITILGAAMAGYFLSAKPKQKHSERKRKKRHG